MVGNAPQSSQPVNKQVSYAVRGDGKTLAEGRSGIWILGQVDIDVPLENTKVLELETQGGATKVDTLFWANARIVTAEGKEIPLAQLPVTAIGTKQPKEAGKDFAGGPIRIAGVDCGEAISAQPQDGNTPAVTRVDLGGIQAARFKATLGGDFPVGDESQDWKTVALRSAGKSARFLTVIEPFEDKRMVKRATASGPDSIRVELADGRVQELKIANFEGDGKDIAVQITETKDGKTVRAETAGTKQNP